MILLSQLPTWLLDLSGAFCVLVSLNFLFWKRGAYWHWSNASLLPYFLLFIGGKQWMLAGVQVCYLLFGLHGLYLWHLEARRMRGEGSFNEPLWCGATWVRENGHLPPEHFLEIAHGHRALEDEAARTSGVNRYVFVDTNAATLMWPYLLRRAALPELHALADECRTRYAHTFVCADDLAHEQDGWRSNTSVQQCSRPS